jgi:hypothetical protein
MCPSKHYPINHFQVDSLQTNSFLQSRRQVRQSTKDSKQPQASRFRQRSCTPPIWNIHGGSKPSFPESIVILASIFGRTGGSVSCHSCQHHPDKERPTQNLYLRFRSSARPHMIRSRHCRCHQHVGSAYDGLLLQLHRLLCPLEMLVYMTTPEAK